MDWRFVVITDERMIQENRYFTFFFQQEGATHQVQQLLSDFLTDVARRHGDAQGWGAKRMSVFFKVYCEERFLSYITGIMDFTHAYLVQEVRHFQTASYMQLRCDQYDPKGYPRIEVISV